MKQARARIGTLGRIGILLGILVAIPIVYMVVMSLGGGTPDGAPVPRSEQGTAYLLIDDHKYLISDRNRDGEADCLVPTGVRAFLGRGVYGADDPDVSCSRSWADVRIMEPAFRAELSDLMAKKQELNASHTSCVDLDDDREVDCVVSVHNPELVILEAPGARCAAKGLEEFVGDQRRAYSEILVLEQAIRGRVLQEAR